MPINIRVAVAEHLTANLPTRTRDAVVEHYAKKEADKRAAALIAGLDKLSDMEKQLKAIKPTNERFNAEGQPVGEPTFTKQQIEDRKKLSDQVTKLVAAINKADDNGDFGDLYNLVK